jgi:nucleotide-binding universal stress UspA family protein
LVEQRSSVRGSEPAAQRWPGSERAPRTVLLATDLTAASDAATAQAIELARSLNARLLVVNVIDGSERIVGAVARPSRGARIDQLRAERESPLLGIVERARATGVHAEFMIWSGDAGPGIVAAAEAEKADLVVVGTHGRGRTGKFLLGSVSDFVINHSACPVLVAR